jgi:hypothetical protein
MNELRIQLVSIIAAGALLGVVLEAMRRRRLLERYALLWLFSAITLLVLAVWRDLLELLARTFGIASPPNALFFVAFAFVLLLLLHFSLTVSRLSDQSKLLAQRLALLHASAGPMTDEHAAHERHGRENQCDGGDALAILERVTAR